MQAGSAMTLPFQFNLVKTFDSSSKVNPQKCEYSPWEAHKPTIRYSGEKRMVPDVTLSFMARGSAGVLNKFDL